jgi:hypothetical protein
MTPETEQSNQPRVRALRRARSVRETQDDGIISVRDYFSVEAIFEVPCYQRGYKWSLLKHPEGKTHLEKLLADLKDSFTAFTENEKEVYHLQGVTVLETRSESETRIELVDGQQRTTSLFLLLLWVKWKGIGVEEIDSLIRLDGKGCRLRLFYGVRENVNKWIGQRDRGETPNSDSNDQDICAFEQAWNTIEEELKQSPVAGKELGFINFVLDQVKLIYVRLNTEQPTKVFSMMNQDRAVMTRTDLVKAKLLSEASRNALQVAEHDDRGSNEWQINHLRSHFARSWDAWRKWWEDKAHSSFWNEAVPEFPGEPPLSRLLRLYWSRQAQSPGFEKRLKSRIPKLARSEPTADFLLAAFGVFIQESQDPGGPSRGAVETFEGLRKLQQILEEWFEEPEIYNWLGLLFNGTFYPKKNGSSGISVGFRS